MCVTVNDMIFHLYPDCASSLVIAVTDAEVTATCVRERLMSFNGKERKGGTVYEGYRRETDSL